jgi:hypothetical protein
MAKSGRWTISFPLVAVLMMALWALVAAPAFAATVAVANTNDAGVGSLRDAIAGAAAGDVLDLSGLSGSIVLSSGELVITKDLTITGPGAGSLSIDGDSTSRVFSIDSGNTLTISGLTITGGNGVGATQSGNGGGVL